MAGWLSRNNRRQDPMVESAVEYMDERFPFWLTKVLNIGQPVMDSSITSAAIQYDKQSGDFTFRMNPEFAATLTDQERAFLMSHEAMHVVRNDMRTHADPKYVDKDALNQAMDAIINDTLTNNGMVAPEWAVSGPRDVGFDCEDQSLDDVYETIIANRPPPQSDGDGDENENDQDESQKGDDDQEQSGGSDQDQDQDDQDQSEGESQDGDGEGDESDADDQGDDDADADDDQGDEAEDETDPTESDQEGTGGDAGQEDTDEQGDDADGDADGDDAESPAKPMAGGGHEGWGDQEDIEEAADEHQEGSGDGGQPTDVKGSKRYDTPEGIVTIDQLDQLDYDEMLSKVEPELVDGFGMGHPPRADWSRPRRSTMSLYPHTNMPSRRDDTRKLALASKRMQLVVFIDNSGSISAEDIAIFRKLASRLPKAKADYLFVASNAYSVEVPAEDVFDESKPFPKLGNNNALYWATELVQRGRDPQSDQFRSAQVMVSRGFRGGAVAGHSCEFDSMQAWIKIAMEDGRLRSYPQSVMVISDGESVLSSATPEEAAKWQVFVNREVGCNGMKRSGGGYHNWQGYGCKIPQENFHRLGDFLLSASHVRQKQRV